MIFFLKEPLDNLLDLQREYQRFVQRMAKNNQLTIAEWQLLQRIADGKNSQELLAEDLRLDTSTLSRQLSKLTTKAFVKISKVANQNNVKTRKSYQYHLSEIGQRVLSQMNTDFKEFGQKVFAQWTGEEKNFLKILINRLTQSMRQVTLD